MSIILRVVLFIFFLAYLAFFGWGLYSSTDEYRDIFIRMLTSAAGLSIIVAFFALWLTLENFLRKMSLKVTGKIEFFDYKKPKNGCSYDSGIASFQLNNYKDKTVVIYRIYLKVKRGLYILLLDRSKNPILLKAYDTHFEKLKRPLYYQLNGTAKVLKNFDLSKAKLCLDTNEGKYQVKKGFKHWVPEPKETLIPHITERDYNLEIKFVAREKSLGMPGRYYEIYFDQEYLEVNHKQIYVGNIETAEKLEELLKSELGVFPGYSVWEPVKKVKEENPDWFEATKL